MTFRVRTGVPGAKAEVAQLRGASPQARPSEAKRSRSENLGSLVTSVLDRGDSLFDQYTRLEDELGIGDSTNKATILGMLARAERNASDAHLLFVAAKVAAKDVEASNAEKRGDLWLRAKAVLEERRDTKGGKAPTKDDIEAQVATMFPEQHRELVNAEYQAKEAIEHVEWLANLWKQRARTLEAMKP